MTALTIPDNEVPMPAKVTKESQESFLGSYDPHEYPPFALTSDIAMFTVIDGELSVLLVRRGQHPYAGKWALPGGFVDINESPEDAAARELLEETGLAPGDGHLEQLATFGKPDRDPRMRVVSVAYVALLPSPGTPKAGSDAAEARFWPVSQVTAEMLAFDHADIVDTALDRVRSKLEYTALAVAFLPETFTLVELQQVYEAVWGHRIARANFRKKVLSTPGLVSATGQTRERDRQGRPAALYRHAGTTRLHPPLLRHEPTASN